jgi:hypothetical protein
MRAQSRCICSHPQQLRQACSTQVQPDVGAAAQPCSSSCSHLQEVLFFEARDLLLLRERLAGQLVAKRRHMLHLHSRHHQQLGIRPGCAAAGLIRMQQMMQLAARYGCRDSAACSTVWLQRLGSLQRGMAADAQP